MEIKYVKKRKFKEVYVFSLNQKIPANVICYIIYNFIVLKLNGQQKNIQIKYKKNIDSYISVLDILNKIRNSIADGLKQMYREGRIGGPPEVNKIVAIDESLFIHDNNTPIWGIGAIEADSRKMRFDVINRRTSENIKTFLLNHVEAGTIIISDGWPGYAFLGGEESFLEHETHSHIAGDFGFGLSSTSHMEDTWAHLKNEITAIYNCIPSNHFILYLREAEFRLRLSKKRFF